MDDMRDYEIMLLKRQLAGLPPPREITLPPDSFMTAEEVSKSVMDIWNKVVAQNK